MQNRKLFVGVILMEDPLLIHHEPALHSRLTKINKHLQNWSNLKYSSKNLANTNILKFKKIFAECFLVFVRIWYSYKSTTFKSKMGQVQPNHRNRKVLHCGPKRTTL